MTTGAVAASGRALTRTAVAPVPTGADVVVVELGPGTGVMTRSIEERLAGRGRQLALEVNARLASSLFARHPAVEVVQADAADLGTVLSERGIAHADVIVSGLPWAAFGPQQQELLLDAVLTGLSSDGVFTTFAYVHSRWTPAARRFRRELEARFDEVVVGRTVWRNLPPALVYHARRPVAVLEPSAASWHPSSAPWSGRDQPMTRSACRRSRTSSSRLCPST